jgi:hypothetical protein
LVTLSACAVVLSPLTVFSSLIITRLVLGLRPLRNSPSRAPIGGLVDALVGSGVLAAISRLRLDMQLLLPLFVITGAAVGIGWGLVLQRSAEDAPGD